MAGPVAYVDSSALVKLVLEEPESKPLRDFLARTSARAVSSILAAVEVPRAARRAETDDPAAVASRAHAVVEETVLLELTPEIAAAAVDAGPASLSSPDSVHLASALSLASGLTAFVVYDARLANAARAAGLSIEAPSLGA